MARLGVITDEINDDLEHALAVCRELGMRDVELRVIWGKSIVDHDDDSLARIERLIRDGGFSVCNIASPYLKTHIRDDDDSAEGATHSAATASKDEQWPILERSLEIADRFDAPIVRAFSYWRVDDPESVREEILEVLTRSTEHVKHAGKKLGLENEYACNAATGVESAWYLDRIDDPAIGLIWDPGNIAALGVQPTREDFDTIRDRILHVHVKDARALNPLDGFGRVGHGVVGWEREFRQLAEIGYDGVVSLETHFTADGDAEAASREVCDDTRAVAAAGGLLLE